MAYVLFILIHIIVMISSISTSTISIAINDVRASFDTSLVLVGWVLSVYLLVATASAVLFGKIADIFGRKKIFIFCTGLFALGSLGAALAPNIWLLILARFVQSVGGGGIVPSMVGIVMELFPKSRQKAMGLSMSVFNLGGILGPSIGAWLVTNWGWRAVFWFNLPIVLIAIIPIIFVLRSDKGQKGSIDYAGVGYFTGGLFAIMIALTQIKTKNAGADWLIVGLLFVIGIVLIYVFWRHEHKVAEPLIDLDLLRLKAYAASNGNNIIFGACVFGISSLIPLFAYSVYNLNTVDTGFIMSARAIGTIVSTVLSSLLVVRWGYRRPMLVGAVLICITMVVMGLEPRNVNLFGLAISDLVMLNVVNVGLGIGVGVSIPAAFNCMVDLMPQKVSQITGVQSMFRQAGGAISIAVITLLVQMVGNAYLGFGISFVATGIFVLLTIPFILAMPSKPIMATAAEKAGK
jgi:MFS family permease